jgi:hypothetical protein
VIGSFVITIDNLKSASAGRQQTEPGSKFCSIIVIICLQRFRALLKKGAL